MENKVALIRHHLQLSQSQLATLMNVSVKTVQGWEGGRYAPNGGNEKLLQLLSANKEMKPMLEKYKNDSTFAPLERDPEQLTIMGVQMPSKEVYDELVFAITNQMYEGYEPTAEDVRHFRDHFGELTPASEIIKW
ncbi:helix-turn-helix domain-containing protein [Schleiferilactobacillus shenzhenensis]|uniref:helix-turn-helix domain-containing protein n=1 Tax=Schleiferilactobacillus shenzhenensis TaxID=1231337 RepID=UPI0012DC6311|nr:transcription regulator, Xre family protein [Schleiferilactobacillus shenzhenensis]